MPRDAVSERDQVRPARELMDIGCVHRKTRPLNDALKRRIIGQDDAVETVTCAFSRVLAGLRDPSRPGLSLLLLGPTGVGKTETARAIAETLFGSDGALTRIHCEELSHSHEIAKLLGSPPGYVGHNIEPLLSQRRIDEHHRRAVVERRGMIGESAERPGNSVERAGGSAESLASRADPHTSVILFDEIEKAHPALWNAVLGILEAATLTLGDNTTTDFTHSIIVMTSNVGSREMSEIFKRRPVGFRAEEELRELPAEDLGRVALSAAREEFPLEFLNRFDEILVYSPLEGEHLERIFDRFLGEIHARAITQAGVPLLIQVDRAARDFILERGTDLQFGARPLRRAMEAELVDPLSRLIASSKLHPGDVVEVERKGDRLVFYRREDSVPVLVA